MPVAAAAAASAAGDDTVSIPVADLRADQAAGADATAVTGRSAADQTSAMPALEVPPAAREGAAGPVLQRSRVDEPVRRPGATAPRGRSWRALRRLRGVALLVVMMVGLGTLLAVTLAGLVALVALGVRAAVGT
jgi:hypothetical protein